LVGDTEGDDGKSADRTPRGDTGHAGATYKTRGRCDPGAPGEE